MLARTKIDPLVRQPPLELFCGKDVGGRGRGLIETLAGRAIAQAVSSLASHGGGPGSSPVRSCGICGGQSGTGGRFSRTT
jgi:hypothetical protein